MRRPRPPLPLGDPGKTILTETSPGHRSARAYVRDTSGRRRDGTPVLPLMLSTQGRLVPDSTQQRAVEAVLRTAAAIRADLDEALSDSTAVRELWVHHRDHLTSLDSTESTLNRYMEVTVEPHLRLFSTSVTTVVERPELEAGTFRSEGTKNPDIERGANTVEHYYGCRVPDETRCHLEPARHASAKPKADSEPEPLRIHQVRRRTR